MAHPCFRLLKHSELIGLACWSLLLILGPVIAIVCLVLSLARRYPRGVPIVFVFRSRHLLTRGARSRLRGLDSSMRAPLLCRSYVLIQGMVAIRPLNLLPMSTALARGWPGPPLGCPASARRIHARADRSPSHWRNAGTVGTGSHGGWRRRALFGFGHHTTVAADISARRRPSFRAGP